MIDNRVNASIITIGDELLIGQTIDTNSAWMGQQLNALGIWVKRRVAVGDVADDIWKALDEEHLHSSIIFITGGLGPTADDITKPLLCKYFGGQMVINNEALQNVQNIFTNYLKRPMLEVNLKQAEVPDVATVIPNLRGTAPGMWFEKEGRIYISMPGVPHEMKNMMTEYVLPRLPELFNLPAVVHRTLLTAGIGESYLAERIKDFEAVLPENIKLAYLPNYGMVRLRLTAVGADKLMLTSEVDGLFVQLQNLLPDVLVINEDKSLQEAIGIMLQQKNKTLATAESCTGGYVAHLITSIAGSSAYFKGSVVSYDNTVKQQVLHVNSQTLATAGAVSKATVIEMAQGARQVLHTDYAVAISGIMGPGGGSAEKPVGTVWIAVANQNSVEAKEFHTRYDRKRNIEITATHALNMLRLFIKNDLDQS